MDWLHGKLIASTFHSAFVMPRRCLDFHLLLSSTCHELLDLHSLGSPRFSLFFPSLSQSSDQLLLRKQAGDWELPYLPPVNPKPSCTCAFSCPSPAVRWRQCSPRAGFRAGPVPCGLLRNLLPLISQLAPVPSVSPPRMLSATCSSPTHPRKQTWF